MIRKPAFGAAMLAAVGLACCTASAQLSPYSQDFEALDMTDPAALGNDGWLGNGLVFDGSGGFKFFYGNFPAPNGGPGFSAIATDEPGPDQGAQYLNAYSDYNCCGAGDTNEGHFNGSDIVENRVFREQIIMGDDVGKTASFIFDAKLPSVDAGSALAAPSTGGAFLRTLDPNAGFSTSAEVTFDALTLSNDVWTTRVLELDIPASLNGHFLQFGFVNVSSDFGNTGVYYDNVNFQVPEPASAMVACLAAFCVSLSRVRRLVG